MSQATMTPFLSRLNHLHELVPGAARVEARTHDGGDVTVASELGKGSVLVRLPESPSSWPTKLQNGCRVPLICCTALRSLMAHSCHGRVRRHVRSW